MEGVLFNIQLKLFNYCDSFTLQLNNNSKLIIDLRGSCQLHQLRGKYLLHTPSYHCLFFLLYLFYILYPLNWLTKLDPLKIPMAYSRRYHSAVNYLFISLLLLLLLLKLLHRFWLITNLRTCVLSYLYILNNSPVSPPIIIFHVLLPSHLLTLLNSLRSLSPVYVLDLLLS